MTAETQTVLPSLISAYEEMIQPVDDLDGSVIDDERRGHDSRPGGGYLVRALFHLKWLGISVNVS